VGSTCSSSSPSFFLSNVVNVDLVLVAAAVLVELKAHGSLLLAAEVVLVDLFFFERHG